LAGPGVLSGNVRRDPAILPSEGSRQMVCRTGVQVAGKASQLSMGLGRDQMAGAFNGGPHLE
jgi:hypothetical protein